MIDVKFNMDSYGRFDFDIDNGDIKSEDGFDIAIWISLFTDARASASQVSIPEYRRGWIGEISSIIPDRQLGGHLWLIDQRRIVQKTLNDAIDYCNKSLQWLIDDNICSRISVNGSLIPKLGIKLTIDIISNKGMISTKNINLWEITGD